MNEQIQLQGIRTLYADDVAANRRYLKALLDKLGLETTVVENGADALQHWEQQRFPLVLLDVHMPDLDGAEVARRIRLLQENTEEVVILGITADLNEALRESLQFAGMNDCILKPTDMQSLLDGLKPWLAADHPEGADHHQAILLDDPGLLQQLLRELPQDVEALQAAFTDNDLGRARSIAHQISGIAALYRLQRLHSAIQALEQNLDIGAPLKRGMLTPVLEALATDLADIQSAY